MTNDENSVDDEIIKHWNQRGTVWVKHQPQLDRWLLGLGRAAMDRCGLKEGERVLDVGCGSGGTTLVVAERVGPTGRVLGIDPSTLVLELARKRAQEAGYDHATLALGDAGSFDYGDERFDVLYSRLGVMFFKDPPRAFSHLANVLAPGGRASFVAWQVMADNPWFRLSFEAVAGILGVEPFPKYSGLFAWADHDFVRELLLGAGLIDVEFHPYNEPLKFIDADDAFQWFSSFGPGAAALRAASEPLKSKAIEALRSMAADNFESVVQGGWIVTARKRA